MKEREIHKNEDSIKLYHNRSPSAICLQDEWVDDIKSQPEEDQAQEINEIPDKFSEKGHSTLTFTRKKWNNIDELISVLQGELHTELEKRKEEIS
mmetsp:Transcript_9621/g.8465  ORF Transcript_9621/g.8465 Transcript_9621/m.8465 type:complete len:95 (+) Transcript_9621:450-734(+)